jgi:hypothetical protein
LTQLRFLADAGGATQFGELGFARHHMGDIGIIHAGQ